MKTFTETEWQSIREQFEDPDEDEQILRDWLRLPESHIRLIGKYGENYTLENAVELLVQPESAKAERRRQVMESAPSRIRKISKGMQSNAHELDEEILAPTDDNFDQIVETKYQEISAYYTDIAPNDAVQLREWCRCYAKMDRINQIISANLFSHSVDVGKAVRMENTLKDIQFTMREIEKLLQIDRAKRDAQDKKTDVEEAIEEINRSGTWVEKFAIKIEHCNILLGWIVPSFPEMPHIFKSRCPRCKNKFVVLYKPTQAIIHATREPDWVVAEEIKVYHQVDQRLLEDDLPTESGDGESDDPTPLELT